MQGTIHKPLNTSDAEMPYLTLNDLKALIVNVIPDYLSCNLNGELSFDYLLALLPLILYMLLPILSILSILVVILSSVMGEHRLWAKDVQYRTSNMTHIVGEAEGHFR